MSLMHITIVLGGGGGGQGLYYIGLVQILEHETNNRKK